MSDATQSDKPDALPEPLEEFVTDMAREYGPEAGEAARGSAMGAWNGYVKGMLADRCAPSAEPRSEDLRHIAHQICGYLLGDAEGERREKAVDEVVGLMRSHVERSDGPDDESYKAVVLLRAVRDEWYTFTGYSQLKVDIDELLERVDRSEQMPPIRDCHCPDRAEFLREAQGQLAKVIEKGDIEAVRWMIQTAADYHDSQESGADAMDMVESARYHEKQRKALKSLLSATATTWEAKYRWLLHNGGLLNEWARDWNGPESGQLIPYLEARIEAEMRRAESRIKEDKHG